MATYIEIGGVKTWYDEDGSGEPLVLLHGGLSTNETWAPQMPEFAERFRVLAPERRGHGHTPDVDGPLSYDAMATDTIGFLDAVVRRPADLVGWSDGGIIGLIVAMRRPSSSASWWRSAPTSTQAAFPSDPDAILVDGARSDGESRLGPRSTYKTKPLLPMALSTGSVAFAKFIDMAVSGAAYQIHRAPAHRSSNSRPCGRR